jgi:hypothetical protein
MALTAADIDATEGGAAANSYNELADADEYFEMHPDGGTWRDANAYQRVGSMLFAVVLMEREVYYARRADDAQALSFPLLGQSAVPLKAKHAQLEQTLDLLKGDWVRRAEFREMQAVGVREATTRETSTVMSPATADGYPAYSLCRAARELLMPFIETTIRLGRA